ncbi:MAG: TonB-dependent receptor [Thermoanaerobaculaceae bacterium]
MKFTKCLFVATVILVVALPALAQIPTGTLTGRATDGKEPLPGVIVTVTSPNLQGARTAVTEAAGAYIFAFLPAGDYNVKFELMGFQTLDTTVKINAAQSATVNATMPITKVAEEVTVTGTYDNISSSHQVATTYDQNLINELPVPRTILGSAALTPGVAATGPSGNLTISGAMSYENLYMVNGVVIQDNVRNTPLALYIEDAIQETTTSTGAISAEFGRFSGGIVSSLTKSGGNEFHATFRDSLSSDKWAGKTPKTASRNDTINSVYEATLGGFIVKDKLWFFAAGRDRKLTTDSQTYSTNIPFTQVDTQKRYEGKFTLSLTPNHRIIASYMKVAQTQTNNVFGTILDLASLDKQRELPQDLFAANYTGIITNNFFVEGQYSKRHFTFVGSGGDSKDQVLGTVVRDNVHYWYSNAPTFCGVCTPEKRDNEDWLVKGSWFATSQTLGSHDIVAGYDSFNDMRLSNNYQSGSNYVYWPTSYLTNAGGAIVLDPVLHQPIPVVYGDGSSDFTYWAVLKQSLGTNFRTNSTFVNDKWRLNNNWSFNVGVRFDKNDGEDASHNVVARDSRISPRLGASYDINGDGNWVINASRGDYVTAIAGSIASQGAGSPSSFGYLYEGPDINTDCDPANPATCLNEHQVLQQVFAWLYANGTNSIGGPVGRSVAYGSIAGLSLIVGKDLKSPYAEESTIGFTKRLGSRGLFRMDYVHREYKDLYSTRCDLTTGQVTDSLGNVSDLKIIGNDHVLEKKYDGVNLQASYRLNDALQIAGNYTWSHTYGNYEGETVGSGPISNTANPDYYPQYSQQKWTNPIGNLSNDQRNRGRVWAVWDLINTRHSSLSASLMESYWSGTPYSAVGQIYSYPYVVPNPGYAQRPTTVTYFFSKRGAYFTDNVTSTDLSVNYSFKLPAFGADLEFYVVPQITNIFNEMAVTAPDTTVFTRYSGPSWLLFNPFTTTPVECPQGTSAANCKAMGANWQKGPNFGKPLSATSYQLPRTFTVSFGVRF